MSGCQHPNLDFDTQIFYFRSLLVEISSLQSETLIWKSSKKGKKHGISLGGKKDKPQPVISVNGYALKNSTYGIGKT